MARKAVKKPARSSKPDNKAIELKPDSPKGAESEVHVFGHKIVCDTEPRGHATPRGRSPLEIVVDASEGFIPLWARNSTLRWQFRESSMRAFKNRRRRRRRSANSLARRCWRGEMRPR